ncbi:MAG: threonine dehydratase [Cyanobacteria bacterium J06621_15]
MQRLKQLFQNSFIRFVAVFSIFFRSVFSFLGNIFGSLGNTLGISNSDSGYFVDSEETKAVEETVKTSEPAIRNRRRPKKSNMDDFMQMAKELNKG